MEKKVIVTILVAVLFAGDVFANTNSSSAGRAYTYIITVGKDSDKADYATITDAVAAMKKNNPDENNIGQIKVYPGRYIECIGGSMYGDDTLWLPKHCDLTGTGDNTDDVIIEHPAGTAINAFTIIGTGDNIISHLKIYSNRGARNGIYLFDNCTLTDCIVDTIHLSVAAEENLVVSDCAIKSMYGDCIQAWGTFSISGCTLNPRGASSFLEVPTGILASGSGSISDVTISSTVESSYMYDGAGLFGIVIKTTTDKIVNISNTTITLELTTKYNPKETSVLRVCGIMSGSQWFEPTNNYQGHTIVKDCNINVTGIEGTDSQGYGAAIMVDGICVRGSGRVDVIGNTVIKTDRKTAASTNSGYKYSLNNQNGIIAVDFNAVDFDRTLAFGEIKAIESDLPLSGYWQNEKEKRAKCKFNSTAISLAEAMEFTRKPDCSPTAKFVPELLSVADGWSEAQGEGGDSPESLIEISSDITTNQIWTANNEYYVTDWVNVKALLVIEPGTVVYFAETGAIFVNDGGTLISKGTPDNPIIYTSDYEYYAHGYYFCPICIESTASPATTVTYSHVDSAVYGILTDDIRLDNPIENNFLHWNSNGIAEWGTRHTDIINNLIYYSDISGIDVNMVSTDGQADANSRILIADNTCHDYQYFGITISGAADETDAGLVELANNIVSGSYTAGLNFGGWVAWIINNTGYYANTENKSDDFPETNPVIAMQNPYVNGTGFNRCYLDQNCPFIDEGLE